MAFRLAERKLRMAPSLLAADFGCLADAVDSVVRAPVEVLHLDIMDGHFVPNISFGVPVIASLRGRTGLFFDAHLMIEEPGRYAEPFAQAGCDLITFHIETVREPAAMVDQLRGLGVSVGVSLNPSTPVEAIRDIIADVDLVLVMSVWPGFGGQRFMPEVLVKVRQLRDLLRADQRLEIDGGIGPETIGQAVEAGADTLVAGSAVFGQPDPGGAVQDLLDRARRACGGSASGA